MGDIDWLSIQKWIGELNKTKPTRRKTDGLSPSRVVQAYHVFRGVLSYAVRSRMLSTNPATDIDLPRKPVADKRYLTHQEVADLAAECGDYDVLVLVLAYCGLRWGEATALKRRDVDFDRARIEVKAAVERVNGNYRLGPTKTHETRSVPVPPPVVVLLRERIGSAAPERLVFPGEDGFLKNYEFRKVFGPAATKAGLRGLSPHELRHTCASLAIRSEASIKTVQRLVGHAAATMTLDNYGHLYPDELGSGGPANGCRVCVPGAYRRGQNGKLIGGLDRFNSCLHLPIARLAQRESASLTRKRSLVQSQYRAPEFMQVRGYL